MQNMDRNQYARTMLEALGLWSENPASLASMAELRCRHGQKVLHLATELQTSALEATQHGQAYLLRGSASSRRHPSSRWTTTRRACRPVLMPRAFYELLVGMRK